MAGLGPSQGPRGSGAGHTLSPQHWGTFLATPPHTHTPIPQEREQGTPTPALSDWGPRLRSRLGIGWWFLLPAAQGFPASHVWDLRGPMSLCVLWSSPLCLLPSDTAHERASGEKH